MCFDGDSAGMKAAYRAVETALPLLQPGRSLAFAFLPDGLDPDDLLRQQGPQAVAYALSETRPLVDVLWAKELAAGAWETPERRAQLEKRLFELAGTIADKTVRLHYEQAMRRRLREHFAPQPRFPFPSQPRPAGRGAPARDSAGGFTGSKRPPLQNPLQRTYSQSLADSPLVRVQPLGLPRREALLLLTVLNHPWLIEAFLEDIAAIQFEAAPLQQLRDRILHIYYEQNPLDNDRLRNQLEKSGQANLLAQVKHAITHNSDWDTQPSTSHDDVLKGWRHRLAMHRKAVELKRELESAVQAYANDPTEQNYLRLQDLSLQLHNADGAEASTEGYGTSSHI
jgi:DNA primase